MNKKTKLTCIISLVSIIIIIICFNILTEYDAPNTITKVIYIDTADDLQRLATDVNSGNTYAEKKVVMTRDIDMSHVNNFVPIGAWGGEHYFYGVFDGNGYTIHNLTISGDGPDANLGLFGSLGGTICNLTIENCSIQGNACGAFCSIAASSEASILNCAVNNANIDALYSDIIGGQYFGIVENCVIDGVGNVDDLTKNYRKIWQISNMTPPNLWKQTSNGLCLTNKKAEYPNRIYITLQEKNNRIIYPLFSAEDEYFTFCIPSMTSTTSATLCLEFANGNKQTESILLPKTHEASITHTSETYNFSFIPSQNTATIFLDTMIDGGFEYLRASKEHELPGLVTVLDETGAPQYYGMAQRIRGRGNDSWHQAKQGFSFKLEEDGNILDLGYDKDYILLPGYRNTSYLTYQIVWDLSREMQWDYVLSGELVQLYVDGSYWGIYFLTEKIESGTERINISEGRAKTGGFIFEYDNVDYEDTDIQVITKQGNRYTFVSPSQPTQEQRLYCQQLFDEFEDALYSQDGYNNLGNHYTEYIDLESFAAQWLFYELNSEISMWSSEYFYKDIDGKIYAFHPWDVEHSYANPQIVKYKRLMLTREQFTNGFWVALASHEDFVEELRIQWKKRFMPALEKLTTEDIVYNSSGVSSISYYANHFEQAAYLNELRWGAEQNLSKKADSIREWMNIRIPFLDNNLYYDDYFTEENIVH